MRGFAENATFHGIFRILTSKRFTVKICWLVIFLGSSGYLTYQVAEVCRSYLDHPVITNIKTRIEKRLRFPSLTFCPTDAERELLSPRYDNYSLKNKTTKHFLDEIDKGTSFVLSYAFGNRGYNYSTYFRRILIPDKGLCYVFNPDGTLFQDRPGSLFGLQISLFVNASEYNDRGKIGVYVSVHPHYELPFPLFDSIGLSPGFSNIIRLEKTTMIRQESPYPSHCTKGDDTNLIFPGKYTLKNCEMSCIESKAIKKCGLPFALANKLVFLNHSKSMPSNFVDESTSEECFDKNLKFFQENTLHETRCNCKSPCHEIIYGKTLSFVKFPVDKFLRRFAYEELEFEARGLKSFDSNFLRNSLLQVWVYFEEMSDKMILEKPEWTVTKLLSDIGGQMGIWLGASIFSLIELLILIGYIPLSLFRNRRNVKAQINA